MRAACALLCLLTIGVFAPSISYPAAAGETTPAPKESAAAEDTKAGAEESKPAADESKAAAEDGKAAAEDSKPAADPSKQAAGAQAKEPNAGTGTPPAVSAPGPAPAISQDSLTVAAPRDSVNRASDAPGDGAKDAQPAQRDDKAAPLTPEKAADAAVAPPAIAKPEADPAPKVTKSGPGGGTTLKAKPPARTRAPSARSSKGSSRGAKSRALAKPIAPRNHREPLAARGGPGSPEADRIAPELERTERFVTRAQKSILLSKNTRAMKLFTSALDFQSDSREAYKVRQYARAERLTLAARDFADRATRMVGPPREDPEYVEHVLRRTDDAIERAKDVLRTGANRESWRRHEDLKQRQKEAWRVFKGGEFGGAYRQTLNVREGVLALLRQLQNLPVPREAAEKAIGGAQAALEQANRQLGPKPSMEAVRLVRLANEYLAKARQSFSRGSYRSALLQAKVVERHVEHAVDVGRPRSG